MTVQHALQIGAHGCCAGHRSYGGARWGHARQSARRHSLQRCQHLTFSHQRARLKEKFDKPPVMFGTNFMFHLHGFQNEQQVARLDISTGVNMPGNDLGLQG